MIFLVLVWLLLLMIPILSQRQGHPALQPVCDKIGGHPMWPYPTGFV